MAAIAHAFTEQNTAQTTTSGTYGDVSGAAITSGNFTAGKKYLLCVTAQINENSSGLVSVKTQHGTTDFAQSEYIFGAAGSADRATYCFMTVWTAVSSEGIKLQFKTSAGTGAVDQISLFAMNLSDDLTENTDWFFAERTNDDALSTTPTDGASVTFTPGTAGQNWLVLANTQYDISATDLVSSNITRSGEASSSTPSAQASYATASNQPCFALARVFSLGASSNTFKEVSASGATSNTRLNSAIFALNLGKFAVNQAAYTDADSSTLSTTNYATNLQTLSITPSTASDVWILAYWGADRNATARLVEFRVQVDSSDQPTGQTSDNYSFRAAATAAGDEDPYILSTLVSSMSAAAHTINLDASVDSATGAPTGQHRQLVAVTMELASTGNANVFTGKFGRVLRGKL
jgi:hypothetical protein